MFDIFVLLPKLPLEVSSSKKTGLKVLDPFLVLSEKDTIS